jgi:hypothetical protein
MEVSERHARTRAIIRDTDSPANWLLQAAEMRRETSRVSFLMCPFCVRAPVPSSTTHSATQTSELEYIGVR